MNKFIVIKNDLFDIANRLKKIDKNYLLVRNVIKNRFELWYNACVPKLELVFKTKTIDKRMLDFVNDTKVQYVEKLIKQMDDMNEKIKEKEIKRVKEDSIDRIKEVLKYENK